MWKKKGGCERRGKSWVYVKGSSWPYLVKIAPSNFGRFSLVGLDLKTNSSFPPDIQFRLEYSSTFEETSFVNYNHCPFSARL